jgi:hypothetical protein
MRSILPMLLFTGLLSVMTGFSFSNIASAETMTAPPTVVPTATDSATLPRRIAKELLRDASQKLGVPSRQLRYEATPKTFGNECEFNFGEICTREYKPIKGWIVVVSGQEKSITYHVAKTGGFVADPKAN